MNKLLRNRLGISILAVIFIGVALSAVLFSNTRNTISGIYSGTKEKISIGAGKTAVLVYIAQEQGFFDQQGLDVTIKDYEAGKLALDALVKNDVDFATAAGGALVSRSFIQSDLRAVASMAKSQIQYIVARRDRNIKSISDLIGKRVGVTKGSAGEYLLGKFLNFNGVSTNSLTLIDLTPSKLEKALIAGDIDAASMWKPYVYNVEQVLGNSALVWQANNNQDSHFLLIAKKEWLTDNPRVVERLLLALIEAEKYISENPDAVQSFIAERFMLEQAYVENVWANYTYRITLPQELILSMEDNSRWRIENGLSNGEMPNYLDFIYTDALKAVEPEKVTIL